MRNFWLGQHARRFAHGLHDGTERHHGRHHGHGEHRRRGGRVFDHGDLRLLVLRLLQEKPRHGYEIIKAIEDRLAGTYSPSPGVIYPTLTLLEELGHAEVRATEGSRKLYAITEAGAAALEAEKAAVDAVMARLANAEASRASTHAPPLVRAMENLKLALRLRTSRGPLSETEVDAIAAALDTAARTIERI
jgi:DNA-binding PadR family transcriptional regulator